VSGAANHSTRPTGMGSARLKIFAKAGQYQGERLRAGKSGAIQWPDPPRTGLC
jgi:hypothetical protein